MVGGAEVVGDAVLAPVADEEDVDLAELARRSASRLSAVVERGGSVSSPGLPVRRPGSPRDDVLEPAEGRAALARRLVGAEAVVGVDGGPAPGACSVTRVCFAPRWRR